MTTGYSEKHPTIVVVLRLFESRNYTAQQLALAMGMGRRMGTKICTYLHGKRMVCIVDWQRSRRGEPSRVYGMGLHDVPRPPSLSMKEVKRRYRFKQNSWKQVIQPQGD